ncbi:hypothetical protein [Pseudoalteromonas piscicida]|uniref:hypothetical protein n=1 Tax=Pseudoalteromonas piscicida TaxID=43662 RepID=UPI000696E78D|nr:hypothetical protein [Pseudoalteromonas piscicida]
MLYTSPTQGGVQRVRKAATESAPYFAANIKDALSLPCFFDNFDAANEQVTCEACNQKLASAIGGL